jgi:predicted N-acetyltransferase YhbS
MARPVMATMIPLSDVDATAVETLLDAAFGADRKSRTAYKLRDGVAAIAAISFAVVEGDALIGTIQCWPVRVNDVALVLVGPVAVAPDAQSRGIGKALMQVMLAAAHAKGYDALMMIGDPDYYGRFFGFSADVTGGWILPGPVERHRLLARIQGDKARFAVAGPITPNRAFALEGANA